MSKCVCACVCVCRSSRQAVPPRQNIFTNAEHTVSFCDQYAREIRYKISVGVVKVLCFRRAQLNRKSSNLFVSRVIRAQTKENLHARQLEMVFMCGCR